MFFSLLSHSSMTICFWVYKLQLLDIVDPAGNNLTSSNSSLFKIKYLIHFYIYKLFFLMYFVQFDYCSRTDLKVYCTLYYIDILKNCFPQDPCLFVFFFIIYNVRVQLVDFACIVAYKAIWKSTVTNHYKPKVPTNTSSALFKRNVFVR